ncbi:MAG: MBL fold metallo-hydrolase [Cyclobacteriaceae bacterium]
MKSLILILLLGLGVNVFAQRATPDVIPSELGEITIQPILHGTLVLTVNDQTIYVDPYGGKEAFEEQKSPDLVLITDIHGDHHNQKTLDALDLSSTKFIAPAAVIEKLPSDYNSETLSNGEETTWKDIKIEALPMYNLPEDEESRHPKGRGNGYVLNIGGKRIYLSGDTEDITEMRALKSIDIAFVCMNLPYTMDVNQAANAVSAFKPIIVYPYHYRGQGGLSDIDRFKSLVNDSAPNVEVRLRNWYPN